MFPGRLDTAQFHNGIHCPGGFMPDQQKKIPPIFPEIWLSAPIDFMSVHNDRTLRRLAENFCQTHGGEHPAAEQIGKQVSRPHGRQLIRVPYQNQAAVSPQSSYQCPHQIHIHHGCLIHNHRIHGQRVVLIMTEYQTACLRFKLSLQQPVDGGGLCPAQLSPAVWPPAR